MRFEDEFSADYADYAEESSEQFNSWRDLKSLFAINSYLCNLRNLLCMRFEEGVIRRLRRLRRLEIAVKKRRAGAKAAAVHQATGYEWVFRPPAVAILMARLLSV